ncbi:hypothetical protein GGR54DRAFT_650641 [Hypoxylon sp. NC1633]|nr:hypothetical protein GGR54DRAFT_650641 [Hypoxylon sp. NC1633]
MALNEAHKSRIIAHMNKEHPRELQHFLRAFNGLSPAAARDAQLTDLTPETLIIASASGTHLVPITPPLRSAGEARPRFVQMTQHAQAQLGLSGLRIATFTPPTGLGVVSAAGVLFYFACAAAVLGLGAVRPGTTPWGLADAAFAPVGGAPAFLWLVRAIFVPVVALHSFEAWWMARTRLRRHGVESGSALWWAWVVDTFVEGWPCVLRFDGLVEGERRKKEGAKH